MIRVVVDDLAFVAADAVVRPSTALLEAPTPALRRLDQVAGPGFWEQLQIERPLEVGAAVVMGAGDLAAEFVIQAIVQSDQIPVSSAGVRRALVSVLQRASDWHLARLAIPPVGTGAGNLDVEVAAEVMLDVLRREMPVATYPEEVCIVVETEEERRIFEAYLERMLP